MSEHRPTTDEVRRQFATVDVGQYTPDYVVDAEEEAAFNRWLAEVERAAAEKAFHEGAAAAWSGKCTNEFPANPYRKEAGR